MISVGGVSLRGPLGEDRGGDLPEEDAARAHPPKARLLRGLRRETVAGAL